MDIQIRGEEPGDEGEVRKLLERSFPTKEEALLVDRLRASGRIWLSQVADMGSLIVGFAALTPVTFDPPQPELTPVALAPLAIHPAHQKKGIGTRLVQSVVDTAKEAGYSCVIVLGNPVFFNRFGFQSAGGRGLRNEYGAIDLFLVAELKAGCLTKRGVLAKYAPEFAGTTPLSWRNA